MVDKYFELEKLRSSLRARGLDEYTVNTIVQKADTDIENAMAEKMTAAMESAIAAGVEKDSVDFINDIRPRPGVFQLETASGQTDFSTPPFPMLPRLLQNAKPMNDGSGVYKVVPVGKTGNKPPISSNIFDAQKAISAERLQASKQQYNKVAPSESKVNFRTATSKQSQTTQWVLPAKEKDFTEDLSELNRNLEVELEQVILDVVREYEEGF